MKSVKSEKRAPIKELKYPVLMEYSPPNESKEYSSGIILMLSPGKGVVVHASNGYPNPVGYLSSSFCDSYFKEYDGTLTLSND